ncbi:Atxe2 family lasso peptide isopeptidase [Sphingomonas soli]|uniref:Atxe2 family lasso peptide isopeptidase n=1 Tax=Sphingomonas soli TaxID=266127 RepID=UPI000ACDC577|nr:Atxe2 family lasso peptide isopeptidase [Sphingomonas soli]
MSRWRLAAALAGMLSSAPASAGCAERLLPERVEAAERDVGPVDLAELRDFGAPASHPAIASPFALSPDGLMAAVALRRADTAGNSYCLGVALVPLDGGKPRLIDVGGEPLMVAFDLRGGADRRNGVVTATPLGWSPDGRWIAYLRRDGGHTQLWRARADGGGAEPLTRAATDVRRFAWTAGGRLRFTTRPGLAPAAAAIEAEGLGGFRFDVRFQPMASDRPALPASAAFETIELDPVTGAFGAPGPDPAPSDPPGALRAVHGLGGGVAWTSDRNPGAYAGPAMLQARVGVRRWACDDPGCADGVVGFWWQGPATLLILRDWPETGRMSLYRWRLGYRPERLWDTADLLLGCQLWRAELICAREAPLEPRRIVSLSIERGTSRPIFDPNPEWAGFRRPSVTHLDVAASDGARTFAKLVLPPGHRASERRPLVIVQYESRGFLRGGTGDEYPIPVLAAQGFAVLSYQRPQQFAYGSSAASLGEFQRINVTGWADRRRAFSGLEAAVDAAIAQGGVDPGRIGITGLSDGASTAAWALIHSRRYRAAIVSSCCEDPSASGFVIGPAYQAETASYGYPPSGQDPEFWRPLSLSLNAERIEAPLLMQLSDREFRMALDAEARLRSLGKPVALYVFPDEYHVKSQPAHRLAIYRRVLAWFDFWLRRADPSKPAAERFSEWQQLEASVPVP